MIEFRGRRITIRYCEQPPAGSDTAGWEPPSWSEAISHIPETKRNRVTATMAARREYLAEGGQLRAPEHWNSEGQLPNDKQFYAIKAGAIRAYGWHSSRHKGVFYISHFAFKRGQKIHPKDRDRVIRSWRAIEED